MSSKSNKRENLLSSDSLVEDNEFTCRASSLLDEAWERKSEDPLAAEALARQALDVLSSDRVTNLRLLADLKARAWIYIANCRRIRSDLISAEEMLDQAEDLLQEGTHHPQERARLLTIRAGLFGDLRRFPEALDLMDQVIAIHRWANDNLRLARAYLTKAHILQSKPDVDSSLTCLQEAEALIDEEKQPWLSFSLKQIRLVQLCETDQLEAAWNLLPEVVELARAVGSRLDRLRTKWVKGLVMGKLGLREESERTLYEVREVFLQDDIHYDAALVSLDLAVVLLQSNKVVETRELAEDLLPLFQSLDISREAFAALILFHRAAMKETATAAMVRDIAAFLKRTGEAPALKYEEPS